MNDRNEVDIIGKITNYDNFDFGNEKIEKITVVTKEGNFYNVEMWNKNKDISLKKGDILDIKGKLKQEVLEKDFEKKYYYKIIADNINKIGNEEFIEKEKLKLQGTVIKIVTKNVKDNIINNIVIANNYYIKKQENDKYEQRTNYFNATIWGNTEIKKGDRIEAKGVLIQSSWEYEEKNYKNIFINIDSKNINKIEKEKVINKENNMDL